MYEGKIPKAPSVFIKMIGVKVKLLLSLGGKSWKVSPLLQGQEKKAGECCQQQHSGTIW